jgi:glycine oxidase
LYPQFIEEVESETGIETEFRNSGLFYLAFNEEDEGSLQEKFDWQKKSEVEVEWISGAEIRKKEPAAGTNVTKGLYFPEDCQVDNIKLIRAMEVWARKLGVEFLMGVPATRIWLEDSQLRGVITGSEKIESRVVINAAGARADFDKTLPFRIPVKPSRGQILVLHQHKPVFSRMIYTRKVYLVTRNDGRIIVGSTVESVGYDKDVTVKGLNKLVKGVMEINPDMGALSFRECWAGLRPRSKDNLPILGKTQVEGLFVAAGHFRNGILLAPITGRLITQLVLGRPVTHDLTPYDIQRFTAKFFAPQTEV